MISLQVREMLCQCLLLAVVMLKKRYDLLILSHLSFSRVSANRADKLVH